MFHGEVIRAMRDRIGRELNLRKPAQHSKFACETTLDDVADQRGLVRLFPVNRNVCP